MIMSQKDQSPEFAGKTRALYHRLPISQCPPRTAVVLVSCRERRIVALSPGEKTFHCLRCLCQIFKTPGVFLKVSQEPSNARIDPSKISWPQRAERPWPDKPLAAPVGTQRRRKTCNRDANGQPVPVCHEIHARPVCADGCQRRVDLRRITGCAVYHRRDTPGGLGHAATLAEHRGLGCHPEWAGPA